MMYFKINILYFVLALHFSAVCSTTLQPRALQSNCNTCAPNPIASIYPNNVTGTINATISVLIVPIDYARSLLPSRLSPLILTRAYTRFSIPPSHYPLVIENSIDHDIRFQNLTPVADFSALKSTFPFIDLLEDNSTCFKYTSYIYLPPTVPLAISGSEAYGISVIPATFDPADAPYRHSEPGKNDFVFKVYPNASQLLGSSPAASVQLKPMEGDAAFPLAFYKNVTNQPIFGNNTAVCDNMLRFWNTSLSLGEENKPQNVSGTVKLSSPLVREEEEEVWEGVQAVRATTAFLENNYIPCGMLKGYKGTGEGDSG